MEIASATALSVVLQSISELIEKSFPNEIGFGKVFLHLGEFSIRAKGVNKICRSRAAVIPGEKGRRFSGHIR